MAEDIQPPTPHQIIRRRMTAFLNRRERWCAPLVKAVREIRERRWQAFLFGGTPRGIYADGNSYSPRDIDIVMDDHAFAELESSYQQFIVRRNRFGGLHLIINRIPFDAWPLSKTWAFHNGHVREASFEALPRTTFLNIDAIAVELSPAPGRGRLLFEHGFFDGWMRRTLDINLEINPYPALCAVRSIHLSRFFHFNLSHRLATYIFRVFAEQGEEQLLEVQNSHYGRIIYDAAALKAIRVHLGSFLTHWDFGQVGIFPKANDQMQLEAVA